MILQPGTYAILNADLSLKEIRTFDAPASVKDGRAIPVALDAQPDFDDSTHKLEQAGWTIGAKEAKPLWQVVELSRDELDAKSRTLEAEVLKEEIAAFESGKASPEQVQRAIAHLLKQSIG